MNTASNSLPQTTAIVDVFNANVDGYGSYRIPAFLALPNGRLLAICEARAILSDHAHNKIVMKTSDDNGATWSEQILIADAGDNALNNPLVLRESVSGDIVLMYQQYPYTPVDAVADPSEWISHAGQNFPANVHEGAVKEGYEGAICRSYVIRSSDNGDSWTQPVDITRQVKRPVLVTCYAGGPGIGIQLQQGLHKHRLIMPFTQGPWDNMKAYAVYSDDGGHTWQYGDTAPANTGEHANETQMAELDDGRLMLNARSFKDNKCRKTAFSSDGGVSWTALQDIPDLVEPECQASIIALPTNTNATNQSRNNATTLLYCGPNNPLHRVNGELKVSNDLGQSWQKLATIYPGSFGYSSIGQLNDKHIGVLFERDEYQAISFVKCVLD